MGSLTKKKIPPPRRRKHPSKYGSSDLRAMLVDDGIKRIPLGGQWEGGLAWMTEAIARIAKLDRKDQETVFDEIKAEIKAETGLDLLAAG
jgi:hypothetical protein